MSNSKHTPGPWRVGDAGHAVFGPKDSGMYPNAPITILQNLANKANVHLIAAAPEMLEALEACRKAMGAGIDADPELWRDAELKSYRAVRKALGES